MLDEKCWPMLGQKFDRNQTLTSTNTISHRPTCPNMVFKQRQHVVPNSVGLCCPKMLHPFKRAFTHIDWLKIRHFTLETFEVRLKTCNALQSKMLGKKSSSALCYMAAIFYAAALREKSALQIGSCNTAFFI